MNLGSQRTSLAVVSWLATVNGEDALLEDDMAVLSRKEAVREDVGLEEAVVKVWSGVPSDVEGRGECERC